MGFRKMTEFNLSDKEDFNSEMGDFYHPKDIKEFIRRLKEELTNINYIVDENDRAITIQLIDKLSGAKLR